MADHSKPTITTNHVDYVAEFHDRINDTARLFDAADVSSATNQPIGTQRINRSIASLQRWDGAVWATFGGYIPSGTVMLFVQAAAPVGWTKLTTHDDKALRIVSGTGGGSGGSVAFTTAFASKTVAGSINNTTATGSMSGGSISSTTATGSMSGGSVGNTTLTSDQMPSHSHGVYSSAIVWDGGSVSPARSVATSGTTYSTSSAGGNAAHGHAFTAPTYTQSAHTHTLTAPTYTQSAHGHTFTGTGIDLNVQYVDTIICRKD